MTEEKLIEAVREHKELYDTKNPNYMKTKLKNRIWDDIANDLNLKDGEEEKTLWLKLRNSYRDARRRQQRCIKSGAAPENIKPWRFQQQMSFLEAFMSTGPREGNVNDSDNDSQLPSTQAVSDASEEVPGDDLDGSERPQQSNVADVDGDQSEKSSRKTKRTLSQTTSSTPIARGKQGDMQSLLKRSLQQREERAKQRAEERSKLESQDNLSDDPLYNFFLSMYQLTKKMPPNYQHKVRRQLFQAVSQAEEEIMNISNRPSSTTTSSQFSHYSAVSPPYPSPHNSQSQTLMHHPQTQQHGNLQDFTDQPGISPLADYVTRFE